MQPPDPFSQLALCCGFGPRRRGLKAQRNFYYSPSIAYLDPHGTWPPTSHLGPHLSMAAPGPVPQTQPYFLLAQPVILAGGSAANQQTNTLTLVQTSQAIPSISPITRALDRSNPGNSIQQQIQAHGAIMSSHYAISSSTGTASGAIQASPVISTSSANLYGSTQRIGNIQDQFRNFNLNDKFRLGMPTVYESNYGNLQQQQQPKNKFISAQLLAKLEAIEKQVDLTHDRELVERHNMVITRALNPYTLMPHLTGATLHRYNEYFLLSPDYVVRFIEIIKRPGQTLGLYLRSIQFEDQRYRNTREGLVITKIETDSPIYNSQVIHVGDEIISINLVEVQGMSMDDVVLIMSKPRRLVLALRIPKDRDQIISASLMQRQQQQYEASLQVKQMNASNYQLEPQSMMENASGNLHNGRSPINPNRFVPINMMRGVTHTDPAFQDSTRHQYHQDQQRQQQDHSLHHARPIRVQSAIHVNEVIDDDPDDVNKFHSRLSNPSHDLDYNNEQLDSEVRVKSLGRPNFRLNNRINNNNNDQLQRSIGENHRSTSGNQQPNPRLNLGSINQHSIDEDDRFQDLDSSHLDHEFKSLVQEAMIDELSVRNARTIEDEPSDIGQKSPMMRMTSHNSSSMNVPISSGTNLVTSYDNNLTSVEHPHSMNRSHLISSNPSELITRRSLPMRPGTVQSPLTDLHNAPDTTGLTTTTIPSSSSTTAPIATPIGSSNPPLDPTKPPAISNIRLGDTPEQSSYFSSSIDAINRELKELRRQRMALSKNETSIDSSKVTEY